MNHNLGIFNSVIALFNQIVEDYGYTNDDAGLFGAFLVCFGILFAGVAGYLLDKTHVSLFYLLPFAHHACYSTLSLPT
jgi:hypothetical protein